MKNKLALIALLIISSAFVPAAQAGINISVGVSLPPLVTFQTPPSVVVMPGTESVYVVPDSTQADIFFWNGWWWRPWKGQWFRSHDYNNGWQQYDHTPTFYNKVDKNWRQNYNSGQWNGQQWDQQKVPYGQLKNNWKKWQNDGHWKNNNGVHGQNQHNAQMSGQQQYSQQQNMPTSAQKNNGKLGTGFNNGNGNGNNGYSNNGNGNGKGHGNGKGNGKGNGQWQDDQNGNGPRQ